MAEHKVWCWEVATGRHGPDWHLYVVVTPECEDELERITAAASLNGFTPCGAEQVPCTRHGQACRTRAFVDMTSAPAYQRNIRGGEQSNLWVYNAVLVHRDTVEVACGYGGRGLAHNKAETAFLLTLCGAPGITVLDWSILAGGEGYDYRTLAAGVGAESFEAYLRAETAQP